MQCKQQAHHENTRVDCRVPTQRQSERFYIHGSAGHHTPIYYADRYLEPLITCVKTVCSWNKNQTQKYDTSKHFNPHFYLFVYVD